MTAIQILEKLGADASFHPSKLTDENKSDIIKLAQDSPEFNAPLILSNHPAEEEPEEDDDKNDGDDK